MDPIYLYHLQDPNDNQIRYVGLTIHDKKRFSGGLMKANVSG